RLRAAGRPGACPTVSGAVRTGLADQPHRPRSQEHAVMKRLVALALLALSLNVHAATEVLPVNYRSADELLPVVESVLGDEGRVSVYSNQLVINASPEKIAEVRELLAQLDSAPRRLLISVDTSESAQTDSSGYRVDGSVRAGDVELQTGRGERLGRDQVRIISRSTASRGGGIQQ